jgi:hypothetical protein
LLFWRENPLTPLHQPMLPVTSDDSPLRYCRGTLSY